MREKGPLEIRYVDRGTYMEDYNKLMYLTLGLGCLAFLNVGLLTFAALPAIYLFVQWNNFGKNAGKVALIISSDGIQSRRGTYKWSFIKEIRIEKYRRKDELFFIENAEGGPEKQFRYNIKELNVETAILYHHIALYYPIDIIQQQYQA